MKYTAKISTAEVNGISMDYAVFGKGKNAFIILPGLSLRKVTPSASSLARMFNAYTSKYTVYVFDRRNNSFPGYTVKDMADDTLTVMRSLGIKKADFYGASQGGMIVQQIAAERPEAVNKAILVSTAARANPTAEAVLGKWKSLAEENRFDELSEYMVDTIYSPSTLYKLRSILLMFNQNLSEEEKTRFIINLKACDGFDLYESLEKITCPVFVISSTGDKVLTAEAGIEIAEKLGSELYVYGDEYGHAVYDEAGDIRQKMLEFLDKR